MSSIFLLLMSFALMVSAARAQVSIEGSADDQLPIEFAAFAHQASLKLPEQPDLNDLRQELKALPRPLKPSPGFDEQRWKFAREDSVKEVYALYDLVWQLKQDQDRARQVAESYWRTLGLPGSFNDFLTADWMGPNSTLRKVTRDAATCTNGLRIIDSRTKKNIRLDGDSKVVNGLTLNWMDRETIYYMTVMGPLKEENTEKTRLVLGLERAQSLRGETFNEVRVDSESKLFVQQTEKKGTELVRTTKHELTTYGPGTLRKSSDLSGETGERTSTINYLAEGQRRIQTKTEGDQGIKVPGYKVLNVTSNCVYAPVDVTSVPMDPYLSKIIQTFDHAFNFVENQRSLWLACLAKSRKDECGVEQKAYDESITQRDQTWEGLATTSSLPSRRLLSEPVAVQVINVQSKEKYAETAVSSIVRAPFAIPDRSCTFVRIQNETYAYCDGGMTCNYTSAKSASCSDGSTCKASSSGVACR